MFLLVLDIDFLSLIQRARAAQIKEMKQTFLYKTIKLSVGTLVTPKLLV